jgi:PTS system ascorbate-specific IIA component
MIGLLLIAHAPLASALAAAARHVYTCSPEAAEARLRVFDVPANADLAQAVVHARALLLEVDAGDGVLVLTDAFGATPGNIATQLAERDRVAVIAGANLPMLLRALCYRQGTLADTADKALAGGTQGVVRVAASAPQNQVQRAGTQRDPARLHDQQ